MSQRPASAAHKRTRRDHASETAEDYVEAIAEIVEAEGTCRVRDLSDRFGVSHVTVTRIVARLVRDGYAATEPYKPIELTSKGRRLARDSRRRHEIVLQFLLAIGLDEHTAALDAEGIEHHVSPRTLARFEVLTELLRNA
ncbi:MAG: transcriptional regulator MntR [Planctomycetota bacterium]|nr:MAG: transcriptional regulator MntR [Planctomycetota bacterium]